MFLQSLLKLEVLRAEVRMANISSDALVMTPSGALRNYKKASQIAGSEMPLYAYMKEAGGLLDFVTVTWFLPCLTLLRTLSKLHRKGGRSSSRIALRKLI